MGGGLYFNCFCCENCDSLAVEHKESKSSGGSLTDWDNPLPKVNESYLRTAAEDVLQRARTDGLFSIWMMFFKDEPKVKKVYYKHDDCRSLISTRLWEGRRRCIYPTGSHPAASVKKIAVFHEGELVQLGSHEELAADKNGKYYELWRAQAQYYEEEDRQGRKQASSVTS